jgi:anti-sigma-K factor RskA
MLEVPDTIRIAWAPFNLDGAPAAEQPNIQGDVVWNDRLESGYLRFVGLKPNDPAIEQYQVWVIDERGLEQKVSGGVFNATADGEVIVPIDPGIAVGRVALFAITVEKPGGTWVPDLKRRVVVAPRS